jgi:hypothetical protein
MSNKIRQRWIRSDRSLCSYGMLFSFICSNFRRQVFVLTSRSEIKCFVNRRRRWDYHYEMFGNTYQLFLCSNMQWIDPLIFSVNHDLESSILTARSRESGGCTPPNNPKFLIIISREGYAFLIIWRCLSKNILYTPLPPPSSDPCAATANSWSYYCFHFNYV